MHALLIEDDPHFATSMELMLDSEGLSVRTTSLGREAVELAKQHVYDIICLDLHLPDVPGLHVIKELRAAKIDTPVIVLSGLGDLRSRVDALRLGADDYLTKPIHRDELIARIRAILRRAECPRETILYTGKLGVNLDAKTVTFDGCDLSVTPMEFSILELLSTRKGATITRDMFLNHLYHGRDEADVKIVDVFICKLRRKLKLAAGGNDYITTVWGRGYELHEPAPIALAA